MDCCEVWSNYQHYSKTYKASVLGKEFRSSGWKSAGWEALAGDTTRLYDNKAHWDTK